MSREGAWLGVAIASAAAHAAIGLALPLPTARAAALPRPPIDVAFSSPPPPRPPPQQQPAETAPPEESRARPAATTRARPAMGAPPAAAAAVLEAPAEASDVPVDFSLLTGDAERFSGGVTAGTATPAKRPGGAGAATVGIAAHPGGAAKDLTSPARAASAAWSCSHLFPAEADRADVHDAVVRIAVQVGADGKPLAITVLSDPGLGFASAARACALGQRYVPARDGAGSATKAVTAPFSVRFTR